MNAIEETFVNTFLSRDKRERWLTFLASEKKRGKALRRLAHVFERDLDPRFVYDKENPPADIAALVIQKISEWKRSNPKQRCQIISNSKKDGSQMTLLEAEEDYDLTTGSIIILIPDKLAYYHPERDNISRQPFKLLFRD